MKKIIIAIVITCLAVPAYALVFKDVPKDHWASDAVYDLVKMGVTQGYPDGTFRGKKNITRFETAIFLSKLAKALGGDDVVSLRSDIKALKAEIAALRRSAGVDGGITGSVEMAGKLGNIFATKGNTKKGPVVNYRLITTIARELGEGSSVKINLDTMDSGFNGANQDLATRMIDLEGKIKVDMGLESPVDIKVTAGPGPIEHNDASGALAAENGYTYIRPRNAIEASTTMAGVEIGGAYIAQSMEGTTGDVAVNRVRGKIGYTLNDVPYLGMVKLCGIAEYLTKHPMATPAGPKDLTAIISATAAVAPKIHLGGKLGIGSSDTKHYMANASLSLADIWDTGTVINLQITKIGSQYMNTNLITDLAGYDVFTRKLINGTVDIGGELAQSISDRLVLKGKGDLRMTGDYQYGRGKANSRLTLEGALAYDLAPATSVDALYRILQDPNAADETTDMAAVSLMYRF